MPRMRILSSSEQEAFDKPPRFDHRERKQFLDLPKVLKERAAALCTPSNQIGFLVMCGYFKATKRFYLPQEFRERDIGAAARIPGLQRPGFSPDAYAKQTRSRLQQIILDDYGFAPFDAKTETALVDEIAAMARIHLKPRLIFDRCVDFLVKYRFQVSRSGVLIELIRSGRQTRREELVALMDANLTDDARGLLDSLFTAPEDQNRYRLTLLKKLPQSTRPSKVREAAADLETLKRLHDQLEDILSVLSLGPAGARYFAGSVLRSRVFQIQRREDSDRHIHAAGLSNFSSTAVRTI